MTYKSNISLLLSLLSLFICISTITCASPPQDPTVVYIKIFLNTLNKIDGVEQSFSSDFYMTQYWEDSRVDGDFNPDVNWTPQLEFYNLLGEGTETVKQPYSELRGDAIKDEMYALSTSGVPRENQTWISSDQRYIGNFLTELRLQDFPFDQQNAVIMVESAVYNNKAVIIKPYPSMRPDNIIPPGFEVMEWDLIDRDNNGPVDISTTDHFYPVFNEYYSQLRIDVTLARQPTYYMVKIVAGVILLVYMCIMVIALGVEEPDRMMGTLTVFLALVSFTFITGSDVPKVNYLTRIDVFTLFSFLTTFWMMLEHTFNYIYHEYLGEDDEHTSKSEITSKVDEKKLQGPARFVAKFRMRYSGMRTRKIDLYFALFTAVAYGIGVAIIFGRPVERYH